MVFTQAHSKNEFDNYEQIVFCSDAKTGLKAIIAMHNTNLGPAVGGCRMWNYASEAEGFQDVLRLSKGMTYKAAISGLEWGGGKAVIFGDPKRDKNQAMLERYGEFVNRLGGHYVTAKDVGIGAEDLKTVKTKTRHVLGIEGEAGSSGDPSPATAFGVYHGMVAAAEHATGRKSLKGMKIALQGLGSVAYYMLEHLHAEGAQIVACDIDQAVIQRATSKYNIEIVSPENIYDVPCDIFAPCALGSSINSKTINRIQAKIIAGAANNQLETPAIGDELMRRGIVYAPDYAINAGGLINIYYEGHERGGYQKNRAFDHVARIGQTITEILTRSKKENRPSHIVADKIAEERVLRAKR